MPIIFGSAGDIISVIQLVQAFVQALDGSRGSGAEYREVKRELLALEKVLLEIHNLADLRAASPEIDAILQAAKYAAEQCHSTIEPYFGRVKKYNKYLQEGGSGSLLIDAFFKARWRLSHHEELTKFRAIINAHVGSLTLLLVTANLRISGISASLTSHGAATSPPVGRAEPSANKEMAQSMEHQMKSTKDITSLIQSFSTVLQLQWFRKFTEDVKQTLQNILHLNILMYMAISPQQDLRADQPLFTPPWVLDDPFGKIDPVHSEFLGSWEAFQSVIENRFKDRPGRRKISRKEYILQDPTSGSDIGPSKPWDTAFIPGRRYEMSVVLFEESFGAISGRDTFCPNCFHPAKPEPNGNVICESCQLSYCRISEVHNELTPQPVAPLQNPVLVKQLEQNREKYRLNNKRPDAKVFGPVVPPEFKGTLDIEERKRFRAESSDSESDSRIPYKRVRITSKKQQSRSPSILPDLVFVKPQQPNEQYYSAKLGEVEELLSMFIDSHGTRHPEVVALQNQKAWLLWCQQKYGDAVAALQSALLAIDTIDDEEDPTAAVVHRNLQKVLKDCSKKGIVISTRSAQNIPSSSTELGWDSDCVGYVSRLESPCYPVKDQVIKDGAQLEIWESDSSLSLTKTQDLSLGAQLSSTEVSDAGSSFYSIDSAIFASARHPQFYRGRRYASYMVDLYYLPNDDRECDAMDLYHALSLRIANNELFFAPLGPDQKRILDVGTGTGIWAIDVADTNPEFSVHGLDFDTIQPQFVPPNCEFYIDDFRKDPLYDGYDFVHMRNLGATVQDWPQLLEGCFRMLKPGGFLEVQELLLVPRSRCGAERLANHLVGECFSTLSVAFAALGINLSAPTDIVDLMTNAGFEDIVMKEIAVPCGPWAVGNDHRQLGTWMLFWLREALPGLINKPLGLGLGLTQMEVEIFWAKLNRELRLEVMRELLLEFTFIVVYGCKPLE